MSLTNKIPISKAYTYIALSILIFSVLPTLLVIHYKHLQEKEKSNPKHTITQLIQTGPVCAALKSEHLEELLGLSTDHPINLFTYDLKQGEEKLLQSGVIEKAQLFIDPPNGLGVDYVVREPLAYISDYSNLVIDQKGFLFPLTPYFTPKRLPEIYLGIRIEPFTYGELSDSKWDTAKKILLYFKSLNIKGLTISKIDVSKLRADSMGKREIVITLIDQLGGKNYLRYLRLSSEKYIEEINHFLSLKQLTLTEDLIVDLRLLPNAYLMPVSEAIP